MRCFLSKNVVLVIAASIIAITSLSVFYNNYRIRKYYDQQMRTDSEKLTDNINSILNEYDRIIISSIKKIQNENCNGQNQDLLRTVLSNNKIRGLTLLHKNALYCSSLIGVNHLNKKDVDEFFEHKLNILDSLYLKPKQKLITNAVREGDFSGVITVTIPAFLNALPQTSLSKYTYIVWGNNWLNIKTQQLVKEPATDIQLRSYKSTQQPFKIAFDYSAIKKGNAFFFSYYLIAIGSVLLIILLILYTVFARTRLNLKRAILNNEFIPYYQLIMSVTDQKWAGAEVLARWQHPKKGLLMPSSFIPLVEKTGLIILMTRMLMKKVARELPDYISIFPKPFHIGFNIHPSHLKKQGLIEDCKVFLKAFPPNTICLTLEINEGQFVESSSELDKLLQEFRKIGITIAVDDFGTGYSNFGYLKKYHIDHLKIDKLFVSDACSKPTDDTYLLDTIISLSKKLKMNTIAEGVETKEQFYHLVGQGVGSIQGFLFSQPAPMQEMIALVSKPVKQVEPYRLAPVRLKRVV